MLFSSQQILIARQHEVNIFRYILKRYKFLHVNAVFLLFSARICVAMGEWKMLVFLDILGNLRKLPKFKIWTVFLPFWGPNGLNKSFSYVGLNFPTLYHVTWIFWSNYGSCFTLSVVDFERYFLFWMRTDGQNVLLLLFLFSK